MPAKTGTNTFNAAQVLSNAERLRHPNTPYPPGALLDKLHALLYYKANLDGQGQYHSGAYDILLIWTPSKRSWRILRESPSVALFAEQDALAAGVGLDHGSPLLFQFQGNATSGRYQKLSGAAAGVVSTQAQFDQWAARHTGGDVPLLTDTEGDATAAAMAQAEAERAAAAGGSGVLQEDSLVAPDTGAASGADAGAGGLLDLLPIEQLVDAPVTARVEETAVKVYNSPWYKLLAVSMTLVGVGALANRVFRRR